MNNKMISCALAALTLLSISNCRAEIPEKSDSRTLENIAGSTCVFVAFCGFIWLIKQLRAEFQASLKEDEQNQRSTQSVGNWRSL